MRVFCDGAARDIISCERRLLNWRVMCKFSVGRLGFVSDVTVNWNVSFEPSPNFEACNINHHSWTTRAGF